MSKTPPQTIFDYIKAAEVAYKKPIKITENWQWNMHAHIQRDINYLHSQRNEGSKDLVPIKNIVRPIVNLQFRAEGFDLKDITLFIDDSKEYFKSLLAKKFHQRWAREKKIDTVIDGMVESYIVHGAALLKKTGDAKPEVVPLSSIAFCNQRDMLAGPIGFKHKYSPDEFLEMKKVGWGEESNGADVTLETAMMLARRKEEQEHDIEVFECHGKYPKSYFDAYGSDQEYEGYLFIVSFYVNDKGEKQGITLFKGKEKKLPLKVIKRDPIHGRALGFGGVEELEDAQVWTTYDELHKKNFKDAASKILIGLKGPDASTIAQKNDLKNKDNLSMVDLGMSDAVQVDTAPRAWQIFEKDADKWEMHGQKLGSAQEAIMGEQPPSGTPLGSVQIQQLENHSLHEYRNQKLTTFWDEIEMDWIMPHISREISQDQEFLAELDLDELQYVSDALVTCETNEFLKEKVLNGELIRPEEVDGYKEIVRTQFKKKGNKHFMKILKGEMKDLPMVVRTDTKGKQKNLGKAVENINGIIRTVLQVAGPAALGSSATWDLINQAIEQSGMNPVDFSELSMTFQKMQQQQAQMAQMPQGAPQGQPTPQPVATY